MEQFDYRARNAVTETMTTMTNPYQQRLQRIAKDINIEKIINDEREIKPGKSRCEI